jgi:putative toxin-antitoxin system antitoxin component (TIGR02293 family)
MAKITTEEAGRPASVAREKLDLEGECYLRLEGGGCQWVRILPGDHIERHELLETTASSAWCDHLIPSGVMVTAKGIQYLTTHLGVEDNSKRANAVVKKGSYFAVSGIQQPDNYARMFAQRRPPASQAEGALKQDPPADNAPSDDDRLQFLANAAQHGRGMQDPLQDLDAAVRVDAFELLGGNAALGRSIMSEEDLVDAIVTGFPADVLVRLRDAGYTYTVLDKVVAPRRTLMRRKSAQQRLTRAESDAAWRLAHVLSMATRVFDGRKAALAWLGRTKGALRGRTPIELLETSVGTAYVERILRTLDWGDVA